MNIKRVFEAIKVEPDQPTLIVAVLEFERQGYQVKVGERYLGSAALIDAEEKDELKLLPLTNGVVINLKRNDEEQSFRLHFLDIDAICITDVHTPPVTYNAKFTTGFFKSGKVN
jgi:hypothetical protein